MIDLDDVQSVILRPSKATTVEIAFVTHEKADEMKDFLEAAAEAVTTTARANTLAAAKGAKAHPPGAVCVGVSAEGLRLCGLEERVYNGLPPTFVAGMRAAAHRLHDDPGDWEPPFRSGPPVHAVVLRYGDHDWGALAPYAHSKVVWKGVRPDDNKEPFGFTDSISDPTIEGSGKPVSDGQGAWDPVARSWRPVKTGEAVLGYVDESGTVAGNPDTAYLERNGSYFVIRKLEQHVDRFRRECTEWAEKFLSDADKLDPEKRAAAIDEIGAQLVGRHKDGRVLGQPPGADPTNGFLYCEARSPEVPMAPVPPSAHIRRSNPRDSLEFADRIVPRHMLFRRGYPYADEARGTQGLLFMACCADLRRQFEFVQSHWLQDGNRFGLGTETDGVAGQRHANDGDNTTLSIARGDARARRGGMPSFVTTRGGEYFLLPSRSALKVLGSSRQPGRFLPEAPGTPSLSIPPKWNPPTVPGMAS
ncbi:MAG: hypothetical protein QOJ69_1627 [Actinomycetota bacterium]|nr:hypothetical protein [Actinomycetota bacterium]